MTRRLTETWKPVCGNDACGCKKTDYNVWAFGLGEIDYTNGYYADPCWYCAFQFKAQHPRAVVHPTGPVATRDLRRFVINREGRFPGHGHTQPHLEVRDVSQRLADFLTIVVTCNYMPDPRYKLSRDVGAFLQGHEGSEWIFIEFWTDNELALQTWENWVNTHYPLEEVVL